jgi:hypothetical protein
VKCNVGKGGFDSLALEPDAGVAGVCSASRLADESVQVLEARLIQGSTMI